MSLDILPYRTENPFHSLQVHETENQIYNFPFQPVIANSKIYIADAQEKTIRIFKNDSSKPDLVIGQSKPYELSNSVNFKQANINIPGLIAANSINDDFYVQSFTPSPNVPVISPTTPDKRLPGLQSILTQTPSNILHFNQKGILQGTLNYPTGVGGFFEFIVKMQCSADGNLYILHKSKVKSELELLVFKKNIFTHRFTIPTLDINLKIDNKILTPEFILPVSGKDFVIGSIAVRNKINYEFIERIIYYQERPDSFGKVLLRNDNPNNYIFWASPESYFYTLQNDGSGDKVLIKIFNQNGEYKRNQSIKLSSSRIANTWRNLYIDLEGYIYSNQVLKNKFIVYKWE